VHLEGSEVGAGLELPHRIRSGTGVLGAARLSPPRERMVGATLRLPRLSETRTRPTRFRRRPRPAAVRSDDGEHDGGAPGLLVAGVDRLRPDGAEHAPEYVLAVDLKAQVGQLLLGFR